MAHYIYLILIAGWLGWMSAFIWPNQFRAPVEKRARGARWGIVLQTIAYTLLWQYRFWTERPSALCISISILLFATSTAIAWAGRVALGRHWRVDAALGMDHKLIQTGIYGVVRHPIYLSMFCILVATGLLITPWRLFLVSVALFAAGTRVRIAYEERLLSSRFDEEIRKYRRAVPAFLPFPRPHGPA